MCVRERERERDRASASHMYYLQGLGLDRGSCVKARLPAAEKDGCLYASSGLIQPDSTVEFILSREGGTTMRERERERERENTYISHMWWDDIHTCGQERVRGLKKWKGDNWVSQGVVKTWKQRVVWVSVRTLRSFYLLLFFFFPSHPRSPPSSNLCFPTISFRPLPLLVSFNGLATTWWKWRHGNQMWF